MCQPVGYNMIAQFDRFVSLITEKRKVHSLTHLTTVFAHVLVVQLIIFLHNSLITIDVSVWLFFLIIHVAGEDVFMCVSSVYTGDFGGRAVL